ncbi:MAG: cytochrome C oxidase subunit IV family protein [Gemmatimonadota bacterium]
MESVNLTADAGHKGPSYFLVFIILGVLTLVEVAVAFIAALPDTLLILILLGLAVWKALLVALYYMHLRFEPAKLWWMVMAPLPLGLILVGIVLIEGW